MPETKTDRKSCHKCHKIYDKKLKQCKVCKNCHAITYCSEECQVADWPRHKDNCVPVLVTDVGDMGRGLVAAKDIKMGEQILIDSVVISLDKTPPGGVMTQDVARSLKEQIQKMPEEKSTQFRNLKSNDGIIFSERDLRTARRENCLREMTIFRSNRIESEEGTDVIFLVLSLINHSCAPNAEECSLLNGSEDQENVDEYELRAIKDIFKGEEITMFMFSEAIFSTKDIRQRKLKETFGFQCKCCVCSGHVDDQDSIIKKIKETLRSPGVALFSDSPLALAKRYETSLDEWKIFAVQNGILMALSQQLHIGSVKMKLVFCVTAAKAAQMARDSVRLNKAMDVWKELVMTTGFEKLRLEYEKIEETIAEWAPQFNSKKPPTKEEIDSFYGD